MKRILCSLLLATLPFGSVLADAPKSKNAKVTLVYQHELPNVPGKSIKGVLVEYGPGGYSPGHTHAKSSFICATSPRKISLPHLVPWIIHFCNYIPPQPPLAQSMPTGREPAAMRKSNSPWISPLPSTTFLANSP